MQLPSGILMIIGVVGLAAMIYLLTRKGGG